MHSQNPMETSQFQYSTENNEEYPRKDDNKIHTINFLDHVILVGRNALSNEKLVSEHIVKHKKCIWMHAHDAKGAHVIICRNKLEGPVPDVVFRRGMDLALWFSANREQNNKIIWSEVQDVFKPTAGVCGVWKTFKQNNVVER